MKPDDAVKLADMNFWIAFDILFEKGLVTYDDVQAAIGRFRDMIPADNPDYPLFKRAADRMERVYQPGPYNPEAWVLPSSPKS